MDKLIKAGIAGFVIAVVVDLFSPVDLLFVPPFVASMIAIYFFELKAVKDAVLVALIIYIFSDWVWGSLGVIALLVSKQSITYTVDIWITLNQVLGPITALLAGLAGSELAEKGRRPTTLSHLPPTVPVPPATPEQKTLPSLPTTPSVPIALSEEKRFCRYCGAEQKSDAVFCDACGKRIG